MPTIYQESIPLYYQIEAYLRFQIESGELAPQTKLPPERELCRANRVSQGTLRKAFEKLERDGLIVRRVGKGTFVAGKAKNKVFPVEMRLVGFLEDLILSGKKTDVKILGISNTSVSPEVAKFFGLREGDKIPQFRRLKLVEGFPLYYVVNYVIPQVGNRITTKDLERRVPLELIEYF